MTQDRDPDRDELDELLAGDALGALDADDRARLDRLLDGGEDDRYRDAVDLLDDAIDPVEPPPSMKADLFAMLDATPLLDAEGRPRTAPAERPVAGVPTAPAAREDLAGPAERRARTTWFAHPARAALIAVAAVAAAVVLFLGGGIVFGGLGEDEAPPVAEPTTAAEVARILAAPDVTHARTDVVGGGTVTVYWSAQLGRSAVVADGIAPLPDSNDYELWYMDSAGAAAGAGLLHPGTDGPSWHVLDGTFVPGSTVGITIEPAGGSAQPTTEAIATVPIT